MEFVRPFSLFFSNAFSQESSVTTHQSEQVGFDKFCVGIALPLLS